MLEHFKHLPLIPAGENEEMYDIEGNLDIEASLSKFNSALCPDPIVVETVEVDEFENQGTGSTSVVFIEDDTSRQPSNIDTNSNKRFTFIPVESTLDDDDILIDLDPPKKVSFVPLSDQPLLKRYFPRHGRSKQHH